MFYRLKFQSINHRWNFNEFDTIGLVRARDIASMVFHLITFIWEFNELITLITTAYQNSWKANLNAMFVAIDVILVLYSSVFFITAQRATKFITGNKIVPAAEPPTLSIPQLPFIYTFYDFYLTIILYSLAIASIENFIGIIVHCI